MKSKITLTILFVIFLVGLSACSKSSMNNTNNTKSEPQNVLDSTEDTNNTSLNDSAIDDSYNNQEEVAITNSSLEEEDTISINSNTSKETSENLIPDINKDNPEEWDKKRKEVFDYIEQELNAFPTEIEGSRKAFIERLDNIQKELDSLPDKKYSDTGTTNAMKNYYGVSYEKYDIALNRIYDLLKKELPSETMERLKTAQIKWIEQKEAKTEKEREKYAGKTHEWVAFYISSYESTKERCYELVNEYMTE
ncbi:MAG TPA: lysozyme inhibitor LprI family protein [Niallia sp.]|nr:lysozyme inhibitor LprI family protein [Niallia sp.]